MMSSYPTCVGVGLSPCTKAMTAPVDILSARLIAAYTNADEPCRWKIRINIIFSKISTSKWKETWSEY